jgi:catechol 2,3-dioxygenase-like lactoylglutathione lyase family enzyme
MRWRGVHHVEFAVLDYDDSIAFYEAMFGWLGFLDQGLAGVRARWSGVGGGIDEGFCDGSGVQQWRCVEEVLVVDQILG